MSANQATPPRPVAPCAPLRPRLQPPRVAGCNPTCPRLRPYAFRWARDSLALHSTDPREHLYSLEQLETSQTHEDIWNAAQTQLVKTGKMHGFMRMYWAKKVRVRVACAWRARGMGTAWAQHGHSMVCAWYGAWKLRF